MVGAPRFDSPTGRDGTESETARDPDDVEPQDRPDRRHQYAGEMKKSVFTILNYLLPARSVLPMHCSANIGAAGDVALFFGLSGTGKTTLSADPERRLIGDDEHGWSDDGVFNFEGGCYAKCIRLSQRERAADLERHPLRHGAGERGDGFRHAPAGFQLRRDHRKHARGLSAEFIDNAVIPSVGGHPKQRDLPDRRCVRRAAADLAAHAGAGDVSLPQRLHREGRGHRARAGQGAAGHLQRVLRRAVPAAPAAAYARHAGRDGCASTVRACWLVNTGWVGGPFGVGERMKLRYTRAMLHAALDGGLNDIEFVTEDAFNLSIPVSCPGVPTELLHPRNAWADKQAYDQQAEMLASKFEENFAKFDAPENVRAAGPHGKSR